MRDIATGAGVAALRAPSSRLPHPDRPRLRTRA